MKDSKLIKKVVGGTIGYALIMLAFDYFDAGEIRIFKNSISAVIFGLLMFWILKYVEKEKK